MNIKIKLCKYLNENFDKTKISVVPKYLCIVTAEQINSWFKYSKIKGKTPFKIENDSLIKIDDDIQRGIVAETKTVSQEKSKIEEIKGILLGKSTSINAKAYLGSLIWNVRNGNSKIDIYETGKKESSFKEYELSIDCESIMLPDSAHRHLAICEAVKAYIEKPEEYAAFDPKIEFPVELYHLNENQERELFLELNSKQKKVPKSRNLYVDRNSPIGFLKSRIMEMDEEQENLFTNNIELNGNTNDKHTLVTMSVFVSSLNEMFGKTEIKKVKDNPVLAEELASYFLNFFYKIKEIVKIKVDLDGRSQEIIPYQNLYTEIVTKEDCPDTSEEALERFWKPKREEAIQLNKAIRSQDIITNNQFFKTFAFIGGLVREFEDPLEVVRLLQKRIAAHDGRFFQKSNRLITEAQGNDQPIATVNADGSLNVQIMDWNLKLCKKLIINELNLNFENTFSLNHEGTIIEIKDGITKKNVLCSRGGETNLILNLLVCVGAKTEINADDTKLKIEPEYSDGSALDWSGGSFCGRNQLIPAGITLVNEYSHETYGKNIKQYSIRYVVNLKEFNVEGEREFVLKASVSNKSFLCENANLKIRCQPSA